MKKYTNKILLSVLGIGFLTGIILVSTWIYLYNHELLPGQREVSSQRDIIQPHDTSNVSDSDCVEIDSVEMDENN
jgi:hypothetical protein